MLALFLHDDILDLVDIPTDKRAQFPLVEDGRRKIK
jgi:hypothetical protein